MIPANIEVVAQLVGALALGGGACYWGGQVKESLRRLCEITGDHEKRIRTLELGRGVPVRVESRDG